VLTRRRKDMAAIVWDPKYSVGVKKIDRQHKKVVSFINRIYNEGNLPDKAKVHSVVVDLRDYIVNHFTFEEEILKKYNYPEYLEQKKEHNEFTEKFCEFQKMLLISDKIIEINLFNFIWDWFSTHITGTDSKYTEFLQDKKIR
jgi:hemerythrin